MEIPQGIVKYILFQRSEYLQKNIFFNLFTCFGILKPFYKLSVDFKTLIFNSEIKNEFVLDMQREYSIIKPFLPKTALSLLDIGCGVAGIDVFLSKHYSNNIKIYLIDKTQIDNKIYYGFKNRGSIYNSLPLAKSLLTLNGVRAEDINIQEITKDNKILFQSRFDIVISLISWGFHYPVSTYIQEVHEKLNLKGILIIDIRKNTGGEDDIKKVFGNCKFIYESEKFVRILAIKNIINA